MTAADRMLAWLREAMDAAECAVKALPPGPWRWAEVENAEGESVGLVSAADTQAVLSAAWVWRHDQLNAYLPLLQSDAVLRRIAADRQLLDDLLAEAHAVLAPGGSTEIYCDADINPAEPCTCGRDERIEQRVRLLAEGYGWTEETT